MLILSYLILSYLNHTNEISEHAKWYMKITHNENVNGDVVNKTEVTEIKIFLYDAIFFANKIIFDNSLS